MLDQYPRFLRDRGRPKKRTGIEVIYGVDICSGIDQQFRISTLPEASACINSVASPVARTKAELVQMLF